LQLISLSNNFNVILKVTDKCNLNCKYCYGDCSSVNDSMMDLGTLENIFYKISTYCAEYGINSISCIWHGGEPLLQDVGFYEKAVQLQNKYALQTTNFLQTNGTLFNLENVSFFKANEFKIGISLDGPQMLHDCNRIYKSGRGSFVNVMEGIETLNNNDISVGALVVISKTSINSLSEIYSFLKANSLDAKINPLINAGRAVGNKSALGIEEEEWAANKLQIVKKWLGDPDPIHLDCVENCLVNYYTKGAKPGECHFMPSCQEEFFAIDYNGDVYPCGEFCGLKDYVYGNINTQTLQEIVNSPIRLQLLQRREHLPLSCLKCEYYHYCYGGCMFKAYAWRGTILEKDFSCKYYKKLYGYLDHIVGAEI
jgi:uncharacterized protein